MKKIIFTFMLMICTALFSSCVSIDVYDPHGFYPEQEATQNEEILKEIIACFDNKDVETLKNMFSSYVQSTCNLDEQIEIAFSNYKGVSTSYDGFWDSGIISSHIKNGNYRMKMIGADMREIITDENEIYFIKFRRFVVYDNDESQLGVCKIYLCDSDGKKIAVIGPEKMEYV